MRNVIEKAEKGDKDILYRKANRRAVFYPFDKNIKPSKLSMMVVPKESFDLSKKSTRLKNIKWEYSIKVNGQNDPRIQTWDEIFGIYSRYQDNLKSKETIWFTWIKDRYKESLENKVTFSKYKKDRLREAKKEIMVAPFGLMKYSYVEFLLSQKNIKKKLDLLVK